MLIQFCLSKIYPHYCKLSINSDVLNCTRLASHVHGSTLMVTCFSWRHLTPKELKTLLMCMCNWWLTNPVWMKACWQEMVVVGQELREKKDRGYPLFMQWLNW